MGNLFRASTGSAVIFLVMSGMSSAASGGQASNRKQPETSRVLKAGTPLSRVALEESWLTFSHNEVLLSDTGIAAYPDYGLGMVRILYPIDLRESRRSAINRVLHAATSGGTPVIIEFTNQAFREQNEHTHDGDPICSERAAVLDISHRAGTPACSMTRGQ